MSRTSARRMEERRDLTFASVRIVRVGMVAACRMSVEVRVKVGLSSYKQRSGRSLRR